MPFFFSQENGQNTKILKSPPFPYDTKMAVDGYYVNGYYADGYYARLALILRQLL